MPLSFTLARLTRLWIKSGISNELGYGRKFLDVAANLGGDDSSKSFAYARYRLKFSIKIVHEANTIPKEFLAQA